MNGQCKVIRIADYLNRKNPNRLPYDEAEARAAERAMEEFDRVAAFLDEEKMEAYILEKACDSKYTG